MPFDCNHGDVKLYSRFDNRMLKQRVQYRRTVELCAMDLTLGRVTKFDELDILTCWAHWRLCSVNLDGPEHPCGKGQHGRIAMWFQTLLCHDKDRCFVSA